MDIFDKPSTMYSGTSVSVYDAQPAYSEFEEDAELTPQGLNEWLRKTPKRRWPKSYLELARIGLGVSVIDWLELSLAREGGALVSEAIVVTAFLYVMSQPDLFESSVKSMGFAQTDINVNKLLKQLTTETANLDSIGFNVDLVVLILVALEGMTDELWPDQVYTLISSA